MLLLTMSTIWTLEYHALCAINNVGEDRKLMGEVIWIIEQGEQWDCEGTLHVITSVFFL